MAKLAFSKLGLKVNSDIKTITYNDQIIEIKQYLPMSEKAAMVSSIINLSVDDLGFYNPLKIKVYLALEVLYHYTNLTFTEKMKENEMKLYDMIVGSGLFLKISEAIPQEEWNELQNSVETTVAKIYEYKNSAVGVLEAISQNYNEATLDLENIQALLTDPSSMGMLQQIIPLLGNV